MSKAAAMKFRNGTIQSVAKIDGSSEYISAMRKLAMEAVHRQTGIPSALPAFTYQNPPDTLMPFPDLSHFTFNELYEFFVQRLERMLGRSKPPEPINTDAIVSGISGMISDLKAAIHAFHPPLTHNLATLSLPDFTFQNFHNLEHYFTTASHQAGVTSLNRRNKIASQAALEYRQIYTCYGEDWLDPTPHCDDSKDDKIDVVLTVTYNAASLGATILSRHMGVLMPSRDLNHISEGTDHDASSPLRKNNAGRYWAEVQAQIKSVLKDSQVDYLLLLGTHTRDPEFLLTLRGALDGHIARGRLLGSSTDAEDQGNGEESNVFVAARGAAIVARSGMASDWDACIVPDRCPRPDAEGDEEMGMWKFDDEL